MFTLTMSDRDSLSKNRAEKRTWKLLETGCEDALGIFDVRIEAIGQNRLEKHVVCQQNQRRKRTAGMDVSNQMMKATIMVSMLRMMMNHPSI